MPSKPRRSKKKRRAKLWERRKDWTPWLWGALGLNVLLGLLLSPVTSLQRVRVIGAEGYDRGRLEAVLRALKGRPCLRLDQDAVQCAVEQGPAVESAEFRANVFGRGVLRVSYKRPVSAIAGLPGVFLSSRGSVFRSPAAPALKMSVEPPVDAGAENLAVFGGWRSGLAAKMCENIAERLPDRDWRLVVSSSGYVSLVPDEGGRVEFGSWDGMETKVQALVKALNDDPGLLAKIQELNLSSPSSPVVRR